MADIEIKNLYQRLKEKKARKGLKYTVMDFCKDMHISERVYYNYLKEERNPSERVKALMRVLEEREL